LENQINRQDAKSARKISWRNFAWEEPEIIPLSYQTGNPVQLFLISWRSWRLGGLMFTPK